MHRYTRNQLRLDLSLIPVTPLLVAADATGQFARSHHPNAGTPSAFIPGALLKAALREAACASFAEMSLTACTSGEPCTKLETVKRASQQSSAAIYRASCGVCRLFGSQALSSQLTVLDGFPTDPLDEIETIDLPDDNGFCEAITGEAFYVTLILRNFECWQIGLLHTLLARLNDGAVLLGSNRVLGLGRVMTRYLSAVVTTFGFFDDEQQVALSRSWHGVGGLIDNPADYAFTVPDVSDEFDFKGSEFNVGFGYSEVLFDGTLRTIHPVLQRLFERQLPAWKDFAAANQASEL